MGGRAWQTGTVLLRALLLGSVTCLLCLPGGALAAGQTPTGAGYSDANVPAPAAGQAPSGAGYADANAPALATGLPTRACANGAGAPASSPTAAGYSPAGIDASVLDAQCTVQATRCPQGTTAHEPEPILAGTTGLSGYDELISARLLDRVANNEAPQALIVHATAGNEHPGGSSNMVQLPELGYYGTTGDLAGCVCAVSATTGAAATPTEDPGSGGVVIRIPLSEAVVGLSLVLLVATVAGLSLLLISRRHRRARTPPW